MSALTATPKSESEIETEYRAIEATLLESATGRWFLAEHGRRARRLDSALLEDAIARLRGSLRQPPALLGQLQGEMEALKAHLAATRETLLARSAATGAGTSTHEILRAAENVHEIAWSLQASPFDPEGCEKVARNAGKLQALSQSHAIESERVVNAAIALDVAAQRLEAMLTTIGHELEVDGAPRG